MQFFSDNSNKSLHNLLNSVRTKLNTFLEFEKAGKKPFVTKLCLNDGRISQNTATMLDCSFFHALGQSFNLCNFLEIHISFPLVSLRLIICSYTWCTGTWVHFEASSSGHLLREIVKWSIYQDSINQFLHSLNFPGAIKRIGYSSIDSVILSCLSILGY